MRQKFTTPLIKLTSLMLILFNFFAVTAIGQEIPGVIETPTVSETALEVVNQATETPSGEDSPQIPSGEEVPEGEVEEIIEEEPFTPIIEVPTTEETIEEVVENGSGEVLSGIIEEIISGSMALIDTPEIDIPTLLQSGSSDDQTSLEEENKLLDMLNGIYEEFILGGQVTKGDEIQITIPNDTDISRIHILDTTENTSGGEQSLSGSYVPFQEEVSATPISEYLPESLIVATELQSEDLRLEENITDNFIGENGEDLSENIEKTFEFGKEGEDLIFSKPLKIEVQVDNTEGIGSYEAYTKHASDSNYNKVGLSTNPETLCDEQGNPTLPGSEVVAEDGVVTFYTCRASDFLLVAQAAYYAACTQPIMFTNATSSITISTGSVSASGYVSGFNQGANSIIEITGSSIVYFTVNKPGVAIGIAVSEYSGIYHSYGNSAYNAIFHSDGNLYPAYSDGPVDSAPYSTGTIYFFLLSGDQVSLHTLDGSYSYTWDDFLYEYPFYVNVNVLSGGSVGNYISEAKLAGESCLDSGLSYCGDGVKDNREQCDLGTGNGPGGACNLSCNWNTGAIDGIVTKTMSGASMCSSGDILDLTLQVDNVGSSSLWVFNYLRDYLPSGMSYISGSFGFSPEDAYPWSFDQGWEMSSTGLIIDGNGDLDDKSPGSMYTFTAQVILNKNFTGIVTNTATIGPFYQRIPSIVAETGVALLNNTSSYSWNCGIGCGDGIVGAGEQCDLGEDNGSGSVCSASCLWNEPTCNDISLTPPSGVANETNIVANLPVVPGLFYDIDRDELGTIYTEAQNGTSYVYTISGTHDAVITVYDQNYDYFIQCNQTMYVGFNGECGSLDGTTISTGNGLDYYTTGLCETTLNPPIPVYNESTNTWTWSCVGLWSGSVASCQAEWEGCGDGVVNGPELCDYNNTGGISCNNQCQPNNLCDVGNWHVYKSYAPDVSWYHLMNGYNTTGILWQYFIIPHTGYLGLGIDSPDSMTFESIQYSMNNTSGFYTNCSYIGNTLNYSYSLISSWNGGVGIGCDYDENDQGPLWYAPQNMNMEITYTYNNNTYVYNINYTGGVSGVDYFAMPSLYEYNEILFPTTCEMSELTEQEYEAEDKNIVR